MKLGVALRVMGPQSTPALILECARAAEQLGLDELRVPDHIAIPPDDAEGSGGRYLDPLATLAFLAAATERIGLGTAVLNLPYRPPLPTAKWVASSCCAASPQTRSRRTANVFCFGRAHVVRRSSSAARRLTRCAAPFVMETGGCP